MNLFQRLKIWKELKRLETRSREEPSPSTFVDLGQVYLNMSMSDRAVQVAEEGLALFPDSDELRSLRRVACKAEAGSRIVALRAQLSKAPDPASYRELANLHMEVGDTTAAISTSEECIRRFPDDAGAYLVVARARLTNFYRDLSARDGLEAARCLQRIVALQPDDQRSHRLLLDLYYRVGAANPALQLLSVVEAQSPGDPELKAIRREFEGKPGGDDLEVLFHNVEAQGRLKNVPVSRQRSAAPRSSDESWGGSGAPWPPSRRCRACARPPTSKAPRPWSRATSRAAATASCARFGSSPRPRRGLRGVSTSAASARAR